MPILNEPMVDYPGPFPPDHPMGRFCIGLKWNGRLGGYEDHVPLASPFDLDHPVDVPGAEKLKARELLDTWQASRLPLEHPSIQGWILQALGYWAHHYAADDLVEPDRWHPFNLRFLPELDPRDHVERHAGVHFVRRFYPTFTPTDTHFAQAHWACDGPDIAPWTGS